MGLTFAAVVATLILRFAYGHTNKKRDSLSEEEIKSKYTEEEMLGEYFAYRWKKSANDCGYGRQESSLPIRSIEN